MSFFMFFASQTPLHTSLQVNDFSHFVLVIIFLGLIYFLGVFLYYSKKSKKKKKMLK
jgi:hypothetical protein